MAGAVARTNWLFPALIVRPGLSAAPTGCLSASGFASACAKRAYSSQPATLARSRRVPVAILLSTSAVAGLSYGYKIGVWPASAILVPHVCDAVASSSSSSSSSFSTRSSSNGSGVANKRTAKQLSTGSLLGLGVGIGISMFSKPIAVVLGLFFATTQLLQYATGARIPLLADLETTVAGFFADRIKRAASSASNVDLAHFDRWREQWVFRLSFAVSCLLAGGFIDF